MHYKNVRRPGALFPSPASLFLVLALTAVVSTYSIAQTAIGSGLNATEGVAIGPNSSAPLTDALWADSTAGRWLMNNHGIGTYPVSLWPCGTSYGCIPYSGTLTGGINTEQGLSYPAGGSGYFLQSGTQSGHNGPIWSAYVLPTSLATAGGVLYGSSSSTVSQSSAATFGSTGALNIAQGSIATNIPAFNHSATWSSGTTTFTDILTNITDSGSAAASKLIDLQVATISKFKIDKAGNATASGQLTIGANGGSAGQVTFNGSSSGSATLGANSNAGTLTSSTTLVAPQLTINSTGGHIQTNSTNTDIAGTFTTSGTTGSVTFTTAYLNTPVCVVTPSSAIGTRLVYISAASTTGFTITLSSAGTITFNYICVGSPN